MTSIQLKRRYSRRSRRWLEVENCWKCKLYRHYFHDVETTSRSYNQCWFNVETIDVRRWFNDNVDTTLIDRRLKGRLINVGMTLLLRCRRCPKYNVETTSCAGWAFRSSDADYRYLTFGFEMKSKRSWKTVTNALCICYKKPLRLAPTQYFAILKHEPIRYLGRSKKFINTRIP